MDIISQEDKNNIIKKLLAKGGDFAEIYFEEGDITGFSYMDKKIETASSGIVSGCGLRLIKGENTYFASQSAPTVESLIALAGKLSGATDRQNAENGQLKITDSVVSEYTEKLKQYISIVEKIDKSIREKSPQVVQTSYRVSAGRKNTFIANSSGTNALNSRTSAIYTVGIVVSDGKTIQTAHEVIAKNSIDDITHPEIEKVSDMAFQRARKLLNEAVPAPAAEMTVVLSSTAGGTMIHEAIGHSLEADAVQRGISPVYVGKIGKKIASDKITVLDNPTLEGARGTYKYDDEGTSSQKTVLVENGILKNYMYDLFSAKKDNVKSTGNGRRESYHHKPIPRMSNTYIAPGKDDPAEILKSVSKGVFVVKMGGGQVNTANGDFIFEVEEGYEISDGKIGRMLRNASLIGNGPEILNSIDMVGTDMGWQPGTCGKDGQGVPVLDGQPTLRIPKITIGGI